MYKRQVFEPGFYEGFAEQIHEDELPIFNWIWFGLWRDERGMNGYTYGLDSFGKDEMEVLGTDAELPSAVWMYGSLHPTAGTSGRST